MLNMHQVDTGRFGHLDLRTLTLLSRLLETASITRTAETFGMSQPAASRAVQRLRKAIGDPLLVRTRKGYALTARAEELRPVVESALAGVANVFTIGNFDPATSRTRLKIATTDYGAAAVISPLMARLAGVAPHAVLDVSSWSDDTLERLESGRCDLALYADSDLPPDFHYRELYVENYALVLRARHPALVTKQGMSSTPKSILKAISDFPRAVMMFPDGRHLVEDDVLDRLAIGKGRTTFRTPYFMSAPWIIADSELVICVPLRVAERMAMAARLTVIPLSSSQEAFSYRMIWHARAHRDPAQIWLRGLIFESSRRKHSQVK